MVCLTASNWGRAFRFFPLNVDFSSKCPSRPVCLKAPSWLQLIINEVLVLCCWPPWLPSWATANVIWGEHYATKTVEEIVLINSPVQKSQATPHFFTCPFSEQCCFFGFCYALRTLTHESLKHKKLNQGINHCCIYI